MKNQQTVLDGFKQQVDNMTNDILRDPKRLKLAALKKVMREEYERIENSITDADEFFNGANLAEFSLVVHRELVNHIILRAKASALDSSSIANVIEEFLGSKLNENLIGENNNDESSAEPK